MKLKFSASKALIKAVVDYFSQDKRFKVHSIAKDNNSYSIEVVDLGDGTGLYDIPMINVHIMHGQLSSFVRSFVVQTENNLMIGQLQEEIESTTDQINAGHYDLLPEFANYCFVYAQELKKYKDKEKLRESYPTYGKLKLRAGKPELFSKEKPVETTHKKLFKKNPDRAWRPDKNWDKVLEPLVELKEDSFEDLKNIIVLPEYLEEALEDQKLRNFLDLTFKKVLREREEIAIRGLMADRSLGEIAKELGTTTERVRILQSKAIRKLRHPRISRELKKFLDSIEKR